MWIVRLALRRPYTFVVLALLIAVLGVASIVTMPVDIFPAINIPVVNVIWNYSGLSPTEMQDRITTVVERAMTTTVSNIEHLESVSLRGTSVIKPSLSIGIGDNRARPAGGDHEVMYSTSWPKIGVIAACCLSLLGSARTIGQVLQGTAAFGSWRDDKPGVRRLIRPHDLPPVSKSTDGPAQVVPMPAGARPQVPHSFTAELVTSDLQNTRGIRVAPNGDLFVTSSMSNSVHVLRIPAGRAKPEKIAVFAGGLRAPFGIAFYPPGPNPRWVYVANSDGVVRFPYKNGDLEATWKPERIIGGIPTAHHFTRDIVFSPDGNRLFFSVGSGSNIAQDMFPEPHMTGIPEPRIINSLAEWVRAKPLGAA